MVEFLDRTLLQVYSLLSPKGIAYCLEFIITTAMFPKSFRLCANQHTLYANGLSDFTPA